MQKAYHYRFYPTAVQENLLRRTMGCARSVYNRALAARTEAWYQRQERIDYVHTSALLTQWKKLEDLQFLNEVSSVALQQGLRHLQKGATFAEGILPPQSWLLLATSLQDGLNTPTSRRSITAVRQSLPALLLNGRTDKFGLPSVQKHCQFVEVDNCHKMLNHLLSQLNWMLVDAGTFLCS